MLVLGKSNYSSVSKQTASRDSQVQDNRDPINKMWQPSLSSRTPKKKILLDHSIKQSASIYVSPLGDHEVFKQCTKETQGESPALMDLTS